MVFKKLFWQISENIPRTTDNEITFEQQLEIFPETLKSEFLELGEQVKDFPNKYPANFWENSFDTNQLWDTDIDILNRYTTLQDKANVLLNMPGDIDSHIEDNKEAAKKIIPGYHTLSDGTRHFID